MNKIIVGVNKFQQDSKSGVPTLKISENIAREQIERLKQFKARRPSEPVQKCLKKIKQAAQGEENLMPLFIEAVENSVTLGEISDTLREVFGKHKETITL